MTRDGAKIINAEFHLAQVVQNMENAIYKINRKPADECRQQNKPRYPLDRDLSDGYVIHLFNNPALNF